MNKLAASHVIIVNLDLELFHLDLAMLCLSLILRGELLFDRFANAISSRLDHHLEILGQTTHAFLDICR